MSLVAGTLVADRFLIEGLAGRGGMGEVFRARDVTTGAPVALKLLRPYADDVAEIERFMREARLLSELRHPGIVAYLADGQTGDGRPFLAMEWLTGQDLSGRLARGALSLEECRTLLERVTDALAAAHGRGVVHRDIKPSNLFLREDRVDRVTLLDFGVARWALGGPTLTQAGHLVGTPGYMAPEQARGEHHLAPSADVFALGCVLFECLTGKPLFVGRNVIAVLAKILLEEIPDVATLRPDTPPALAALLARMLAKDPARRPADAAALRDEIAGLELHAGGLATAPTSPTSLPTQAAAADAAVLGGEAMQLFCVVIAQPRPGDPEATLPRALAETEASAMRDVLRGRLVRLGGRPEWLADGSLVVVVPPSASALDQASQAARCALAVQEHWSEARVALTTGRGVLRERLPAGDAIDRAVSLLRGPAGADAITAAEGEAEQGAGASVRVDELSARLLEARFEIEEVAGERVLRRERVDAEESRLLLGRPSPCVGREQDLSMLLAAIDGCIESCEPSGALVVAPPGIGKSRLRHELLRRLRDRSPEAEVLLGSGTPMSAESPYGMLGEAIRRLCDVQVADPPASREEKIRQRVSRHVPPADAGRVGEFLATLCLVPVAEPSPLLQEARSEPQVMAEHLRRAFLDFVAAESATRPCLLVLEDLHWSDEGTVALVDAALLELRERPFFVLAFARPEVHERFPGLWEQRMVQRLRLSGLAKKAAERLVAAALGPEAPAETVARIVEQAAGNALFLEELIRAAAEGRSAEQPETVLAMLQARLSCLDAEARRVLCSASVFGQRFWSGGVVALLGPEREAAETKRWLDQLAQAEIVERQRSSRFPDDTEYRFRHALVRDAAYGLLPEEDRKLGHRLASLHLGRAGESDARVPAEHAQLGGDMERAALLYGLAGVQLMITFGYQAPEVEAAYGRVDDSCTAAGTSPRIFPSLWGLWIFHQVRADYMDAERYGEKMLVLAAETGDSGILLGAHQALGATRLHRGKLRAAHEHLSAAISIYDAAKHRSLAFLFGQDAAVFSFVHMAWLEYHLGEPQRARSCIAKAFAVCDDLGPPISPGIAEQIVAMRNGFLRGQQPNREFEGQYAASLSRGFAEHFAAVLGCLLGDLDDAERRARTLMVLSRDVFMPHWEALGQIDLGWAMAACWTGPEARPVDRARAVEAASSIRTGIALLLRVGSRVSLSYWRAALVQAEIGAGNLDEAEALLVDTLRFVEASDERYFEPELHRLTGELALARGATPEARAQAAAAFSKGLEIAERQGARGLAARIFERLAALEHVV